MWSKKMIRGLIFSVENLQIKIGKIQEGHDKAFYNVEQGNDVWTLT